MNIQGKVALVTGGSMGIGKAIVLRFAQEGAKVAFCARRPEDANEVMAEAKKIGGQCIYIKADIARRDEVEQMVKTIDEQWGEIDILVNNAGGGAHKFFIDSDEETWERDIAVNFMGTLRVTKAVLKGMVQCRSGSIVNVASDAARVGLPQEAVYSGCKGGIISFSKSLALEVTRYNIRVNCIAPGFIDTPLLAPAKANPEMMANWLKAIPMRRMGSPEETAAAVLFLASDEAGYITGQTLSVSGGVTMI